MKATLAATVAGVAFALCAQGCGPADSGSRSGRPDAPIRVGRWEAWPYRGGHVNALPWLTETCELHHAEWVRLQGQNTPPVAIRFEPSQAAVADVWREHHAAGHDPMQPHQHGFACQRCMLAVTWAGALDEGWSLLHHIAHAVYGDPGHLSTQTHSYLIPPTSSRLALDWWQLDTADFQTSLVISGNR